MVAPPTFHPPVLTYVKIARKQEAVTNHSDQGGSTLIRLVDSPRHRASACTVYAYMHEHRRAWVSVWVSISKSGEQEGSATELLSGLQESESDSRLSLPTYSSVVIL